MKNSIVLLLTVGSGLQAWAGTATTRSVTTPIRIIENWNVTGNSSVSQAVAKKEDGDVTAYPREERVQVRLSLSADNNLDYEKRERKIHRVVAGIDHDGMNAHFISRLISSLYAQRKILGQAER